ncbi:MAG: S8 family serine peptidase, partial [Spirochaetota bacterium]|nr:S8 family serine peptidase [Spirochaetota bacterium]
MMNKFINKCIDIRLSIILIPVISSLILIGASPIKFNKSRSKIARQYIEGEILIKFKKKIPQQNQINTIRRYGCETLKTITKNSISHVKLERGTSVEDAIDIFNNDPSVEYAQPNYIYTISAVPNDTEYGELWGLKNTGQTVSSAPYATNNPGTSGADMNLEPAWDVITDCSSIVVAVIDTGVDYNHEDLAGNMWDDGSGHSGYDFIHNDNDPMDLNGHGTHCAGSIGAIGDNSTGTTGICWQAKIMAVRVLNAMGWGTTVNIIDGIIYAVDNGAKILSMSLGGPVYDHAYSDAITYSLDHDVIVVAAAGNGGDDG